MDAACRAEFGQRAREARARLGLTRDAVAQLVGRDGNWIYNIERGRQTPDPMHLYKLADALKVQSRWLATGDTQLATDEYQSEFREWLAGIAGLCVRLPVETRALVTALVQQVALQSAERDPAHLIGHAIDRLPDHPDSARVQRQLRRVQRELKALAHEESPSPPVRGSGPPTRGKAT